MIRSVRPDEGRENSTYLLHSAHDKALFRRRCFEDGEFGPGSRGGMKGEAMGDGE